MAKTNKEAIIRLCNDINKKEDYYTAIIDYISGMTDNKAIDTYNKIIIF